MDSMLIPEAQVAAKLLLEEQANATDDDNVVAIGLDDVTAVFTGSHPLHETMTATFDEDGVFDDWRVSTLDEHAEALRVLVAHVLSDRAKRVF